MALTETIIARAKYKPVAVKNTRQPSTTVDESGCIITRGFVIPSRNPSTDSVAISTNSSLEDSGVPGATVQQAPASFAQARGAGFHTPSSSQPSGNSFKHRSSKSASAIEIGSRPTRPSLGRRRQTWQPAGLPSSAWLDEELASVKCASDSAWQHRQREPAPQAPPIRRAAPRFGQSARPPTALEKNEQMGLAKVKGLPSRPKLNKMLQKKPFEVVIHDGAEAEDAIASDGEDECDEKPPLRKINGLLSETRVNKICHQKRCEVVIAVASEAEDAIASDSDDDDDEQMDLRKIKGLPRQTELKEMCREKQVDVVTRPRVAAAEDAVASDSEDEGDMPGQSKIAAENQHLTYAARRARDDAKVKCMGLTVQMLNQQARLQTPAAAPAPARDVIPQQCTFSSYPTDNAIESDDESDDDTTHKTDTETNATLSLAQLHAACNPPINGVDSNDEDEDDYDYTTCKGDSVTSAALSLAQLNAARNSPVIDVEDDSTKETVLTIFDAEVCETKAASPAKAKSFLPHLEDEGELKTPTEVRFFKTGSAIPPHQLRPSRSRPTPSKGVLKKSDSQSSGGSATPPTTRRVLTVLRRDSTPTPTA